MLRSLRIDALSYFHDPSARVYSVRGVRTPAMVFPHNTSDVFEPPMPAKTAATQYDAIACATLDFEECICASVILTTRRGSASSIVEVAKSPTRTPPRGFRG